MDAITNAVGLALGGSPTAGVITGAVSPYINTEIKQATEGNTEANLIAHALWGAVEAYAQGGKAGAGAVAAVTGEVGAKLISEQVFDKSPENLTEAEKQTVSELSQVAAGLASGLTSSSGSSLSTAQAVKTGQEVGKNAVENNALMIKDIVFYERSLRRAIANGENTEEVHKAFKELSEKQRAELLADCDIDCRIPVLNELGAATNRADELTGGVEGIVKDWLGTLSGEEQTRFYQIAKEENQKTIEALKAKQSDFENAADIALASASMFSKESDLGGKGQSIQSNLAKKVKNPNVSNKDWKYIPPPKKDEITGFGELVKVKDKTPVQGGGKLRSRWKDNEGNIYEWDSQHGSIEKYNKRGKHLGEFDFKTGVQTKAADPTRRVEP
ncbi:TPA: colicin E3/pyocin S6 family cytotoxin [Mannheimia haemolytica]